MQGGTGEIGQLRCTSSPSGRYTMKLCYGCGVGQPDLICSLIKRALDRIAHQGSTTTMQIRVWA